MAVLNPNHCQIFSMKKRNSILDEISTSVSPSQRAFEVSSFVKKVGFDWDSIEGVKKKLIEELEELDDSIEIGSKEEIKSEMGDVFLCLVNLCIYLNINPDDCLIAANDKFEKKFKYIENEVLENKKDWSLYSSMDLDNLWNKAKQKYK
mgnify:CR=1 FL=1